MLVGPENPPAVPALVAATFLLAVVGALVRWRIAVLGVRLARAMAAGRRRAGLRARRPAVGRGSRRPSPPTMDHRPAGPGPCPTSGTRRRLTSPRRDNGDVKFGRSVGRGPTPSSSPKGISRLFAEAQHLSRAWRRRHPAVPLLLTAAPVLAHEEREVDGYDVEVGFMNEPVFVGDKSGLEFFVNKDDQPVTGLEKTLKAEVIYGTTKRDLPLDARLGEAGAYESVFIPTAAGQYTFHIYGTMPTARDGRVVHLEPGRASTRSRRSTAGQFPVQLATAAELQAAAAKGQDAANLVMPALVIGIIA